MHKGASFIGWAGALGLVFAGLLNAGFAGELGIENTRLTPVGAIRAGNAEGTIPPWEGGLKTLPAQYQEGQWYVDPFLEDTQLFEINKDNYPQYQEHLTPGQVALFQKYPDTFVMQVYPSHRSAAYPDWYYAATINGEKTGLPYPVPQSGMEAMLNHTYYYRGSYRVSTDYGFGVFEDGTYQASAAKITLFYPLYDKSGSVGPEDRLAAQGGAIDCFLYETLTPPRAAGQIISGCKFRERLNQDVMVYTPGVRRVRVMTNSMSYDNPAGTTFPGVFQDQRDIFTLSDNEQNYQFDAPQRVEKYIPYNNYRIAQPGVTLDDLVRVGHLNSDLKRYELHRVWLVSANIKPGEVHTAPRRTIYMDEDSWAGATGELYNTKDELFRVSEAYLIDFYNVGMVAAWGDSHMNLDVGRHYSLRGYPNVGSGGGNGPPDFGATPDPGLFSQAGMRKLGTR